jgi:hypothetical protein
MNCEGDIAHSCSLRLGFKSVGIPVSYLWMLIRRNVQMLCAFGLYRCVQDHTGQFWQDIQSLPLHLFQQFCWLGKILAVGQVLLLLVW